MTKAVESDLDSRRVSFFTDRWLSGDTLHHAYGTPYFVLGSIYAVGFPYAFPCSPPWEGTGEGMRRVRLPLSPSRHRVSTLGVTLFFST